MLQLVLLFFIGMKLDLHAIYWVIWGVAFTIESINFLSGIHFETDDEEDNNEFKEDFAKAASKGVVIKNQNFVTARGVYQIVFVRYEDDIYFFKHRDGQLVECCNLSNLGNNQDKASMT